jgi:NAD(P)-dependent dehydrogenase (short-subunit alcohol dehydrogenase family)
VDILINNVGIFGPKPFLEIPYADWLHFFEINVMSGVRLSRALFPHMLERNWGRIIFISSESGVQIPSDMVHYGDELDCFGSEADVAATSSIWSALRAEV